MYMPMARRQLAAELNDRRCLGRGSETSGEGDEVMGNRLCSFAPGGEKKEGVNSSSRVGQERWYSKLATLTVVIY